MRLRPLHLGLLGSVALALAAPAALADGDAREYEDPLNDAIARRTSSCNCEPIATGQNLPDLDRIVITPWQTPTASTNPYAGSAVSRFGAHMVRIDIVLRGVINPPGTLGLNGLAYNPTAFGPSPLFGSVEVDIDGDRDTGGDQPAAAAVHFLGNVARFGTRPQGPSGLRIARSEADLFQPWYASPQVCLSGADWVVTFCGCFETTVVSKANESESTFGPGSSWVVQGRFFQRAGAYQGASLITSGTAPGLYDPLVRVRFEHSVATNRTTVSLVYALDQAGANLLGTCRGSISEGVADLIDAADHRPLTGLAQQVTRRWAGRSVMSALDTTRWRPTFLIGTASSTPSDGLYIWTDAGFGCHSLDVTGDGDADLADRAAVEEFIEEADGGPDDADGVVDGVVTLADFGTNFSLYDLDGDGVVGPADLALFNPPCAADADHSGALTVSDIFAFLSMWFSGDPRADFDHSGSLAPQDLFDFLNAWFAGC